MPYLLQNDQLELHIDLPQEGYQLARFDWCGKITQVFFRGISLTGTERTDVDPHLCGRGLYNEFGMDPPPGFAEAAIGEWFHKIGIGLLKKEEEEYQFHKAYQIRPAQFSVDPTPEKLVLSCISETVHGYAYVLRKEIELLESSFVIHYELRNIGKKAISTPEYSHNFLCIDQALMDKDYQLSFPFSIQPQQFGKTVNPEQAVLFGQQDCSFSHTPHFPFFFSYLSGGEMVEARWELIHQKHKIGIREIGSFTTNKVNLWGWTHVISPELFVELKVGPGETKTWSRTYEIFSLA